MKAKALALVALLLCAPGLVAAAPIAPLVITEDHGGRIDDYLGSIETINAKRQLVVIDGQCISACTLLLGRVPAERVCVTDRAVFGFHSASFGDYDTKTGQPVGRQRYAILGTRVLTWRYPPAVRAAIRRHGWDMASPHPQVIMIPAAELGVYRPCGA